MHDLHDVEATLATLELQRPVTATARSTRCVMHFQNPNGAGEIEIEIDFDPSPEQLEALARNLPVADRTLTRTRLGLASALSSGR